MWLLCFLSAVRGGLWFNHLCHLACLSQDGWQLAGVGLGYTEVAWGGVGAELQMRSGGLGWGLVKGGY